MTIHPRHLALSALSLFTLLGACSPARTPVGTHLPDADGDGIADVVDVCPGAIEDGQGDAKDGCPVDQDGDGVLGKADQCPDKPETFNRYNDEDGCPDEVPPPPPKPLPPPPPPEKKGAKVTASEIKIDEEILFETGSADIAKSSDRIIEEVAKAILDNPDIQFVEVSGHADKRGTPQRNRELTQKRSEAVQARLVKLGVAQNKLRSLGFGSYCPLDEGNTEAAFAKNRRVEFHILRRAGQDLEPRWGGCKAAEGRGIKPQPIPASAPNEKPKPQVVEAPPPPPPEPAKAEPPPPQKSETEARLEGECHQGKAPSCNALGLAHQGGNGALREPQSSLASYQQACDRGDQAGCTNVGRASEHGMGAAQSLDKARTLYATSCEKGEMNGCDGLGALTEYGRSVKADAAGAVALYRKGCQGGVAPSCMSLGLMRYEGRGTDKDQDDGIYLVETSCKWGYRPACEKLRTMKPDAPAAAPAATAEAKVEAPRVEAKAEAKTEAKIPDICTLGDLPGCTRACDAGEMHSCFYLGIMYEYGRGTPVDLGRSHAHFQKALAGGVPMAGVYLGLMFEGGIGVAVDGKAAFDFYSKACQAGLGPGCTNVGILHLHGRFAVQSDAQAVYNLRLGCDRGDGNGCDLLGVLHLTGKGVPLDVKLAATFFARGCDLGVAPACEAHGELMARGEGGITLDRPRGIARVQLACDRGFKLACAALSDLATCRFSDPQDCIRLCNQNDAAACFKVGAMFETGSGVSRSDAEAAVYFKKAFNLQATAAAGINVHGSAHASGNVSAQGQVACPTAPPPTAPPPPAPPPPAPAAPASSGAHP